MLPLSGPRIILQEIQPSDLDDFLAYRQDPVICKFQGFSPMSREQGEAFIEEMVGLATGIPGKWKQIGIWSKSHNKLVGDCAIFRKEQEPRIAEVGITLHGDYQGQGFARESMGILIRNVFDQFDLHKIMAGMDARNEGAIRLIERLGFSKEAHHREQFFDYEDKMWIDEVIYGLLRKDFSYLPG